MAENFHLFGRRFATNTRKRYTSGVTHFLSFTGLSRSQLLSFRRRTSDLSSLDKLLCNYVHYVYERHGGTHRGRAESALHGLVGLYVPHAKGKLQLTLAALSGWSKTTPSQPRTPLVRAVVFCAARWLWRTGKILEGVAVLVSFGGFLRIGELLAVRKEHVLTANELSHTHGIHIPDAKTGKNQFAELVDEQIVLILKKWIAYMRPARGTPIFPTSQQNLRRSLGEALRGIKVELPGVVFHSLRHGAATQARLDGRTINEVMELGRWAVSKTAHRYVKRARVLGMQQELPQRVLERGATLEKGKRLVLSFRRALERASNDS